MCTREPHRRKSPRVSLTSATGRTKIEPSPNASASAAPLQDTQAGHLRGRSASQCLGQGAETGTARKVRLTCFRVLKRQHAVDPLLVAGGGWTSSRGSASSSLSALVAIAVVHPFYLERLARK